MDNKPNYTPSDWKKVKEFEEHGVVVIVSALEGRGRPKFNIEVGSRGKNGRIMRYFPIYTDGQGRIEIQRVSGYIAKLTDAAEDWIQEESQRREDEFIARRLEREQKQLDRDKPKPVAGLKTLGKRDAATKTVTTPAAPAPTTETTESTPTTDTDKANAA